MESQVIFQKMIEKFLRFFPRTGHRRKKAADE